MHAYKIYGIYLTFIVFNAMLTNHTFTDYFITVEPSILDAGFFLTGLYWSIGSTDFSFGPPFILLLRKCTRHIFIGTCECRLDMYQSTFLTNVKRLGGKVLKAICCSYGHDST